MATVTQRFGQRVKKLREKRKMSQLALAQRARHPDWVFEIERIQGTRVSLISLDNHQPLVTDIEKLARPGRVGKYRVVNILPPIESDSGSR